MSLFTDGEEKRYFPNFAAKLAVFPYISYHVCFAIFHFRTFIA